MAAPPMFFEKSKIDLDRGTQVTITVTDAVATNTGQAFVDYLRNRRNDSGWATTDSNDAANTTLEIDIGDEVDLTDIFILNHNLAAYTLKYWDGVSAFVDFSPAISISGNTDEDTRHAFEEITTTKLQLVITGTQVANDDKFIAQIIPTQMIGVFQNEPEITDVEDGKDRKVVRTISGKAKIIRTIGAFSCSLKHNNQVNQNDLNLVETLYDFYEGFLLWLCGGDISQFRPDPRIGYRFRDIYLVAATNEYEPEYADGFFRHGNKIDIKLSEVV